ncbi:MAG: hypothetical protein KDD62_01000 [Bdellovibrionales bacterium]|nr:hypothetical protein [Bdellovibrionales bacterium]
MEYSKDHQIILHCALPVEAKLFVELFDLDRVPPQGPFTSFSKGNLSLICSGLGKIHTAAALASVLSTQRSTNLFLINLGFSAAPPEFMLGTAVLMHKITDQLTERSYFPDMSIRHSFNEASLITVDQPACTPPDNSSLVDMEASAFCEVANMYVPSSRFAVLKLVSDHFSDNRLQKKSIREFVVQCKKPLEEYLKNVHSFISSLPHKTESVDAEYLHSIYSQLRLSVTQKIELEREIKAFKIRNGEPPSLTPFLVSTNSKHQQNQIHARLIQVLREDCA